MDWVAIGTVAAIVVAVAAGVLAWSVSKQHQQKKEQKRLKQAERRLLAQLEQERRQREEMERRLLAQLEQEKRQRKEIERRLLAQREQERQQREQMERRLPQLEQEKRQREQAEHQLLAQLQQERQQREQTEHHLLAQLEQERQQRKERERRLLAQLEQEKRQHEEIEGGISEIESGIRDLENSLSNFFGELAPLNRTPKLTSTLRDLLASGRWKEADQETLRIMLKVARREKEGWLNVASIQNFPCEDLRAIDQLWVQFSNGRFGFSVQKRIWESVRGNLNADDKIRKAFGDRVGWRVNKKWLKIDSLTFNPSAPVGHLPAVAVRLGGLSWSIDGFWWEKREAYEFLLSQKDL